MYIRNISVTFSECTATFDVTSVVVLFIQWGPLYVTRYAKTGLPTYADSVAPDQPAHPRGLI